VKPTSTVASLQSEDALVLNLKQQIQCLELEVQYLKTSQGPARQPPSVTSPTMTAGALNTTVGSATTATLHRAAGRDELVARAEELEAEVLDLRQKYALREQSFQLELATLRQKLTTDAKSAGVSRSIQDVMQRREADLQRDLQTMRQLHAQEVVALQRTVERLQLESQNSQSHIAQLVQEKEGLLKEIVSLREQTRVAITEADSAKKQLEQAMVHVATEQGARRAAEVRDAAARQDIEGLHQQAKSLEAKLACAVEARVKAESDALNAGYEIDQLKLTVQRQRDELNRATQDAVSSKSKAADVSAKFAELEIKLGKAAQGLVDLQSEREFFRLQVDRLKVENSVLEVKAAQSEQALMAERASSGTLERQLCSALEQADTLRREARAKEDVYRRVDDFSSDVRVQLRSAEEDRKLLLRRLEETSDALEKAQVRLEQVKSLEDQQRTEQQLQQALAQLSKSKLEMQAILFQQQRVADAFNTALEDLPEVAHPNRSLLHLQHASTLLNATVLPGGAPTSDSLVQPPAGAVDVAVLPVSVAVLESVTPAAPAPSAADAAAVIAQAEPPAAPAPAPSTTTAEAIQLELQRMAERIEDEERRAAELLQKPIIIL
jgi:hypothetical protein